MKAELGAVIARRKYFKAGDDRHLPLVEVEMGAPAKSPYSEEYDEFLCSFRVKSRDFDQIETVYGIDELQALQLALAYLEFKLRMLDYSADLRWEGDESGDLGIRIPPIAGGA